MKNLLSTALFGIIFLGLAALAFLSAPRGASEVAASTAPESISANVAGSAPSALLATNKFNNIAVPLIVSATTADDVAAYIDGTNNSIKTVARYDAATQSLVTRNVGSPFGVPNFAVNTGDWLLVSADSAAPTTFAWVGDVPAQGSVSYSIVSGFNAIMLPLDQASITTADALAASIGNVSQVSYYNATTQSLITRNVGSPFGVPNFAVQIGYPYLVNSTATTTWPTP
jgi:hypothetical protein